MRTRITHLVFTTLLLISAPLTLAASCEKEVLRCYINEPENIQQSLLPLMKSEDKTQHVIITTYTLASQFWPKPDANKFGRIWQHTLVIYQPEQIKSSQALLFVNGGTRFASADGKNPMPHKLDFARIAKETASIVVDLQDVPNQQLQFEDKTERKEDSLVAYSWHQFLNDPLSNQYWPVHLPMTKAVIKAMDAVQKIELQENKIHIEHFVIAGASKRGWATWLTALADDRVIAIVPIVIDILNTKINIEHIYASYNNHWPPAFNDYLQEKIIAQMQTPAFAKLMAIEDPIVYLQSDNKIYRNRLRMPKYIISASCDDFFVPDSLNLYLDKLPGETLVRVVPNQRHYIDMKIVEEALLGFYQTIVNKSRRPALNWKVTEGGKLMLVRTKQKPISVRLWEAENPNARDFRLTAQVHFIAKELTGSCHEQQCEYQVVISVPTEGWKAYFVEAVFASQPVDLVLTTSSFIIPAA